MLINMRDKCAPPCNFSPSERVRFFTRVIPHRGQDSGTVTEDMEVLGAIYI